MERTEPTLVPEWLRCTGNVAGGGASSHQSDVSSSARSMRSRYFRGNSEKDSQHYLDRSSSSNSRHSSNSNGSTKHPYSSFSKSRWDKNRDTEKDKSLDAIWDNDSSDPLLSILSQVERRCMRRSQSLVSRKPAELLPRRVEDSRVSGNGVLSGGSNLNVTQNAVFEQDFSSIGTEEKQGGIGVKRVVSPGLSSVVQSLPIGNSGFLCGEKWTSALVEVPPPILANNGVANSCPPQSVVTVSNSSSGVSNMSCLNMAEALSQPAVRVHVNPQQPDKSQRLEELAIKQSRQLIPMTPSMPKPLVSSSADKTKQSKIAVRTNETAMVSRGVHPQPHSTHLPNQSRAGQVKSDSASASHVGKFLVLKPGREIISIGAKDGFSDDANGRVINDGQVAITPATPTASTSLSNSMVSALANNVAALSISSRSTVDKKSTQSLAQSRSEFFNLMRRQASPRATTTNSDSSLGVLPTIAETSAETSKEGNADVRSCVWDNGKQMICNGDQYNVPEKIKSFSDVGENSLSRNGSLYPDEEEAAFLRSLGWDENGGEDEGLTEEEINAFYHEYMNRRPSLELSRISQPKCSTLSTPNYISVISESSSSESEPEA